MHTEIEPAFQGARLAAHLARFSLDDARERGLAVLPFCPYIDSWIRKHPEYTDLVPQDRRAELRPLSRLRNTEALTRVWLPDSPDRFGTLPTGIEADVWTGGEDLPDSADQVEYVVLPFGRKAGNGTEDRDAAQPQDRPDPLRRRGPRPAVHPQPHHALQCPRRAHRGHRRADGRA